MIKTVLTSLLVLILASPLNAGVATWMAMSMDESSMDESSMDESGQAGMTDPSLHLSHNAHSASMDRDAAAESGAAAHDHDSADCEEYCASCSNHCSSTAIVSSQSNLFARDQLAARFFPGVTLHRHDTPFRPPIRA